MRPRLERAGIRAGRPRRRCGDHQHPRSARRSRRRHLSPKPPATCDSCQLELIGEGDDWTENELTLWLDRAIHRGEAFMGLALSESQPWLRRVVTHLTGARRISLAGDRPPPTPLGRYPAHENRRPRPASNPASNGLADRQPPGGNPDLRRARDTDRRAGLRAVATTLWPTATSSAIMRSI